MMDSPYNQALTHLYQQTTGDLQIRIFDVRESFHLRDGDGTNHYFGKGQTMLVMSDPRDIEGQALPALVNAAETIGKSWGYAHLPPTVVDWDIRADEEELPF